MIELIWQTAAPSGPLLGSYLMVAIFYFALVQIQGSWLRQSLTEPRALCYLPVAIFGTILGNQVFEVLLYSSEFWRSRHVNSFAFESLQGLGMLIGVTTYGFILRATYKRMLVLYPDRFRRAAAGNKWRNFAITFLSSLGVLAIIVAINAVTFWPYLDGLAHRKLSLDQISSAPQSQFPSSVLMSSAAVAVIALTTAFFLNRSAAHPK